MTTATKHTFKLKYGNPTSPSFINLSDGDHGRSDYVPSTAAEGAEDLTESGIWRIHGTSKSDLVTKIRAIEDVFRMAAEYDADHIGANQVFLTAELDGSEETWESEIFEGRLELPNNALGGAWKNLAEYVTLIWRRAPWWECYTDDQAGGDLIVSNDNKQAGVTYVFNNNDGSGSTPNKKENWATVTGVPGDVPAAAIILFGVAVGSMDQLMICQNARTPDLDGHYTFEGETGTNDTNDANRSGGKYHDYTVSTGTNIEWTHAHLSTITGGAWLRCMISAKFSGTVKFTPYLKINGVKYYGPSSLVTSAGADFGLYDLGMLNFPSIPTDTGRTGFTSLYYGILMTASAGVTVSVDYAHFMPVDSFLTAKFDGSVLINTGAIIDTRNNLIVSSTNLTIDYSGTALGRLWLTPGKTNYLYFKWTVGGVDSMTPEAIVSVRCYARKRTL